MDDTNRTRKVSNPHIKVEEERNDVNYVVFKQDTLLFYSPKYILGKLESQTTKMKEVPKGSKIKVQKTILKEGVNVSQSVDGMWFEWTDSEAHLKY